MDAKLYCTCYVQQGCWQIILIYDVHTALIKTNCSEAYGHTVQIQTN